MSEDRFVSEDLFRRQLEVTDKLAGVVMDNSAATKAVSEVQIQQSRLLEKIDERNEQGRTRAVDEVKEHITTAMAGMEKHVSTEVARVGDDLANKLEFYNKPQFWLAIIMLVAAVVTNGVIKAVVK